MGVAAVNAGDRRYHRDFSQTDKYTDVGFDSQYQYQGGNYWFTLRGTYIHELQKLDASFANGLSANPSDTLNEAQAYASLAYGNDNRIVLTGQYFNTWGTPDTTVRWACERLQPEQQRLDRRDRLHSIHKQRRAGLAMVQRPHRLAIHLVQQFDGTSVGASANNTLFPIYGWRCSRPEGSR